VDIKLGGALATPEEYEEVKALGGLFVIGTERHEARRIDNQLRGRAGRQGDPGATRFFVSLEDTLMRVFASDSIKKLMGNFGIPEDEAIENGLVSRALESAQTKIEGFNFDARKHVLEFDNVLDKQRRAVYARRKAIMMGSAEEVEGVLTELAAGNEEALKVIKEKSEMLGREHFLGHARVIVLQTMDMLWVEHLESMEYLRGSVNLRAYGQRDPLVEYRKEGARLYRELEMALTAQTFELIEKLEKHEPENSPTNPTPIIQINAPQTPTGEIGRNDPCPCGSGKKWKNCGLKNTEEHQRLMAAKK
jgi:preprotein translocase subunit SecA